MRQSCQTDIVPALPIRSVRDCNSLNIRNSRNRPGPVDPVLCQAARAPREKTSTGRRLPIGIREMSARTSQLYPLPRPHPRLGVRAGERPRPSATAQDRSYRSGETITLSRVAQVHRSAINVVKSSFAENIALGLPQSSLMLGTVQQPMRRLGNWPWSLASQPAAEPA